MALLKIILPVTLFLFFSGCLTSSKIENGMNFTTEGFLNESCYQVTVKGEPAKGITGLVNQRESAFITSKKKADNVMMDSLVKYCVSESMKRQAVQLERVKNLPEAEKFARTELARYQNTGFIAAEYYLEDNTVVIVYRVKEAGIRNRIDSIFIKFEQ